MNLASVLLTILLLSESFSISAQKIFFKNYTVQDGLAGNGVKCILQDSSGFMWFGTGEGLSKYDGNRFTNYSTANGLAFNFINSIYEISFNKFLVAENDGTTDVIEDGNIVYEKRISHPVINTITALFDNKIVAMSDFAGLCTFKEGKWETRTKTPYIINGICLLKDSFYAINNTNIHIISAASFEEVAVLKPKPNHYFTCLYTDNSKTTWAGTFLDGLKILQVNGLSKPGFEIIPVPSAFNSSFLMNAEIVCLFQDTENNYWIGTNQGLVQINTEGKHKIFTIKDGLPGEYVHCIFQDREENIWVGTSGGVSKLVMKNNMLVFDVTPQYLWKKNNEELFAFSGTDIKLINTNTWKLSKWKGAVISERGAYMPAIHKAAFRYQPVKKNSANNQDIISSAVKNKNKWLFEVVAKDTAGGMYYGAFAFGLVYSLNNKQFDTVLKNVRTTTLDFDNKNRLFAGTWENGIFCIYNKNGKRIIENISGVLPHKSIRCSFEDRDGNLWLGLRYGGLVKVKQYNFTKSNISYYNKQAGLSSGWVTCITQDSAGNIWVGTSEGMDKLVSKKNGYKIFNFSKALNLYPAVYSIIPTEINVLWCSTSIGIIRIEDGHLDTANLPTTVITAATIGALNKLLTWQQLQQQTSLDYTNNSIHFEYSVPSFINEKQIQYSYRLMGSNDTGWSTPSTTHSISYASLQNGKYQFEVRALNWNGEWGKASIYNFVILPPWWKTWWFISLLALIAITIVYSFYRYRLMQAIKLQAVRNRIATDLHDEIGSTLTNISILSELSKQKLQSGNAPYLFLNRISEEVNASNQALDDIIWSVNENNDSFDEMLLRMRRYAGELFDADKIDYSIAFDEQLSGLKIEMEQRRDIYLLFKESVNNIHKHAAAKNVFISIKKEDHTISMQVEDDGKGFEVIDSHRNGIKNMHSRVQKWNGKLSTTTAAGKGTKLYFTIPIK